MLIQANIESQQAANQPKGKDGNDTTGPGSEIIPKEAKPIGVKGLKWHRIDRTDGAGGKPPSGGVGAGKPGANSKSSSLSLQQSIQHGVKHEMKAPK